MNERAANEIRRWKKLRDNRGVWANHWDDLARVMLPRRLGFNTTQINGESRTEDIFDGTPLQAARGLANAIAGLLRPEGRDNFSIRLDSDRLEKSDEIQNWLADAESGLRDAFEDPRARFRQATGEADLDLVVFGTAPLFIGEGRKRNHLLFQSVHLKDATVFFNEEGTADGLYREYHDTIRQAMARFERLGTGVFSDATREKIAANELDEKITLLRSIVPREEAVRGAFFAKNLPYTDNWIEVDAQHEITAGGFHEFPFAVPRWDTSSGEDYGRSPGMIALPDANTLQAMGETLLIAGQRAADPPLMAPNDGSFDTPNTFPGGLAYYDVETAMAVRGNPFFPLDTGSNMPLTRDMQQDMRQQVFAAFFRNVLNLPVDGPEMTAAEVYQRREEFLREIGPVFGRLESDYTAPMVERAFQVMLRRPGALPEIPESLQGQRVQFEYESPVKRVRQQIEAAAAAEWANRQIERATVLQRPDIADSVNFDALGQFEAEAEGLPHVIVNSADEVAAMRQRRAEEQQAAQEMQALAAAGEFADKAAGAANKAGLVEA
jgi:hypothetical protein